MSSQRIHTRSNHSITIQTNDGTTQECAIVDTSEGVANLQNVVIIESGGGQNGKRICSADPASTVASEVTQPPAVLTAAAALGMNLTSEEAVSEVGSGNADGAAGDGGGSDANSDLPTRAPLSVEPSGGGVRTINAEVCHRSSTVNSKILSESSQTSNRQHQNPNSDHLRSANVQNTASTAATHKPLHSATASEQATPSSEGHAHPQEEEPEDSQDSDTDKMIDASDFRMVDPGCTYPTLAAAAAANGRMTPPAHHQHHNPHHALHHSHAMASYVNTSYTTLTPLQPLPPISTISSMQDKFQTYSPSGNEGGEPGTPTSNSEAGQPPVPVSVSNFMQSNLSPYMSMSPPHYPPGSHAAATAAAAIAMSAHSPPQTEGGPAHHYPHNGGSSLLSKQEPLSPNSYYAEAQRPSPHHDMSPHSLDHSPTGGSNGGSGAMVPTSNYEALTTNNNPSLNGGMTSPHTISPVPHTSPLLHHREMSPPSPPTAHHGNNGASILAAAAASALGHHNPHNPHMGVVPTATPTMVTLKSTPSSNNNNSGGSGGEAEEINTKELAQRISAELKRYSIPQAIFAQRVLCRSQGTLSDLLRNPKPWSKLKSGRETFRRMQKWLQEPEFQRMSALRLAGKVPLNFSEFVGILPHCV